MLRWRLLLGALILNTFLWLAYSPAQPAEQACREPTTLQFNIIDRVSRTEVGFTQGLEVYGDKPYESTGHSTRFREMVRSCGWLISAPPFSAKD